MWFRMIGTSGTALAKSATSGIWGNAIMTSRDNPFWLKTFAPSRKVELARMPSLSRLSTAGSGLQVTLCRMPRNRLGLAACNASRTGATLAPSFKSAWPMMAAAALLGP